MYRTDFANNLVVLQNSPRNVDAIIVPIGPRHMLVHIGIYARHDEGRRVPTPPTIKIRVGWVFVGCREEGPSETGWEKEERGEE